MLSRCFIVASGKLDTLEGRDAGVCGGHSQQANRDSNLGRSEMKGEESWFQLQMQAFASAVRTICRGQRCWRTLDLSHS